jgi:hypothetical protein
MIILKLLAIGMGLILHQQASAIQESDIKELVQSRQRVNSFLELQSCEDRIFNRANGRDLQALLSNEDPYLACRTRWEILTNRLQKTPRDKRRKRVVRELLSEFIGFVHAKTGTEPPAEWRHFLEHGYIPEETDQGITEIPMEAIEVKLDDLRFRLAGQSAYSDGKLGRLGEGDQQMWSTKLWTTCPEPDLEVSGRVPRTLWVWLVKQPNSSSVQLWGADENGVAYVVEFDLETGTTKHFLFLHSLLQN